MVHSLNVLNNSPINCSCCNWSISIFSITLVALGNDTGESFLFSFAFISHDQDKVLSDKVLIKDCCERQFGEKEIYYIL